MEHSMFNTQRPMALISGWSLLAMAMIAGFAYGYAFQSVYVANDAAATITNLNNSTSLFRLLIFSFLLILVLDVIVAWALYIFFRQSNESWSLLTAWLRLVYAGLLGIALLPLIMVLQLLENAPQNETLIMNGLKGFLDMWSLGLLVFGCYMLSLGYLVLKSGFIPKVFGILILLAGVCYFFSNIANLLMPDYDEYKGTVDMVLSLPMAIGELGIALWLLLRGGKRKD